MRVCGEFVGDRNSGDQHRDSREQKIWQVVSSHFIGGGCVGLRSFGHAVRLLEQPT